MYYVAGLVLILYLILTFLSRKETVDSKISVLLKPFYRIALYLYKRVCIHGLPLFSDRQVKKDLERLHPGERQEQVCTDYYMQKTALSLLVCLVGTFLGVVISAKSRQNLLLSASGSVTRGTYEEGAKDIDLECSLTEEGNHFRIQVGARRLGEEEIGQLYDSFCRQLPDYILGENTSLSEVSQNLCLQETYEEYPFTVVWHSDDPDLIHNDGTVNPVYEGMREVKLKAEVSYGDWEAEIGFPVNVVPLPLTPEELLYRDIEEMLIASEQGSRMEEEWQLPDSWQGQEIIWREKSDDAGPILWVGAIVVSILIYLLADKDLHETIEQRKKQMKRRYPDVVHKLVLYLGAGMTIRGAFCRMAENYVRERKEGKPQCPVYEEMLYACRELQAGVSEGAVYEHFGKRTGVQEYIRLSALLTQNLKKGNKTLLQRLKEEADKQTVEQLQYGKRLGEEAVTKLLLPMVMMLLVVMLIIMIPAFSSVGT